MDDRVSQETIDYIALRRLQSAYADIVTRRAWPELATIFIPEAEVVIDRRDVPPLVLHGPAGVGDFIAGAIARFDLFDRIIQPDLSSSGAGGVALRAALQAVADLEPNLGRRRRPAAAATHEIFALQRAGVGPVEIARRLGVSRMTVWRKLKAVEAAEA